MQKVKLFKDGVRVGWQRMEEIISKGCVISGKDSLLRGMKEVSQGFTSKFQTGWLKVTRLGKVKTVIRLGIKS